jgi:signal transduction histidine kinase
LSSSAAFHKFFNKKIYQKTQGFHPNRDFTDLKKREGHMPTANFDENKLKDILKSALREALIENRELMQDIVEDALEDLGLARAIEQGLETGAVSRKKVFEILENAE